jgi:hypothetical protein
MFFSNIALAKLALERKQLELIEFINIGEYCYYYKCLTIWANLTFLISIFSTPLYAKLSVAKFARKCSSLSLRPVQFYFG